MSCRTVDNVPGLVVESITAPNYDCAAGVCVRTAPLLEGDPADVITVWTCGCRRTTAAGTYTNTAGVTWDSGSASCIEAYDVTTEADLSIAKSVIKDEICLGAYGFYEVVVSNDGPSDAVNVVVTDALPEELVYGGGSPECARTDCGQRRDVHAGTLAAGERYDLLIGFNMVPGVISGTYDRATRRR